MVRIFKCGQEFIGDDYVDIVFGDKYFIWGKF